jgi:hypothetical protein
MTWLHVFSGISSAATMDFTENEGKLFAVIDIRDLSLNLGITWEESLWPQALTELFFKDGVFSQISLLLLITIESEMSALY